MKTIKYIKAICAAFFGITLVVFSSCERDPSEDVTFATFSNNPGVFIDSFSSGLEYLPFAGSKFTAFTVEEKEVFSGTLAMRFDVPNVGDPEGSFAGAIFPDMGGRDLSGYDALTFYAKATTSGTINEIGFGNDFGENKFLTTATNLRLTTTWTKYAIPIPDPSKLKVEKGLFWYAEGPENDNGYTFWIDDLKYEKLGTIAQPQPAMVNGEDRSETAFAGIDIPITGLTQTFNFPTGENVTVLAAPSYFTFASSDNDIARVSELGVVSIVGEGTAIITAQLAGVKARGSLTVTSIGSFVGAPTPTRDAANVISVFSDEYNDISVDFYNGFFAPFQTTLGGATTIGTENIIQYTELNFVATEFKNPTLDTSEMTHLHVDIQIQEDIDSGDFISIELGDFGPDNVFGGDNDSSARVMFSDTQLNANEWISLDIPLSDFTALTSRANLAQIFFISDGTISTILVDNMYFYKE